MSNENKEVMCEDEVIFTEVSGEEIIDEESVFTSMPEDENHREEADLEDLGNVEDSCFSNFTRTENGAKTFKSTRSDCLDLFSRIGALRNEFEGESAANLFVRSYVEDNSLAIKTMFYARDIRGGLGERRLFREMLVKLAELSPEVVVKNLENIAEYGRYDDLLCLLDTSVKPQVVSFIKEQLQKDIESLEDGQVSLLAKWLPSINASCVETRLKAKELIQALGMTNKDYRKMLSNLRNKIQIIENNLRVRDYSFDYSKQTSKSLFKYRKAFARNDNERYTKFFEDVQKGEAKLNTQTLYPYELIKDMVLKFGKVPLSKSEKEVLNITWKNLPDYTNNENALVVADLSGSMFCGSNPSPAAVSISLAIYFAERNKGLFGNQFVSFSAEPNLINLKGKSLFEKVQYCKTFNICENTNIQKVFECVLKKALAEKAKQEEMPSKIYIISDMEFDSCANGSSMTNFEYAKKLYEKYGYELPQIVFWNVNARSQQSPVEKDETGVVLVSGCSPSVFKTVMNKDCSPYQYMLEVLGSSRYDRVICE